MITSRGSQTFTNWAENLPHSIVNSFTRLNRSLPTILQGMKMAQCKSCKKVGFFFTAPKYGLCMDCLNAIKLNYELILPVIQELIDLAEDARDVETITTRLDLAIQHTRDMMEYDSYGVFDLTEQLRELQSKKQKLIYKRFLSGYQEMVSKNGAIPVEVKRSLLKKFKSELQRYYPILNNYHSDLNTIYQALEYEIAVYAKKGA